jgi:hypothetical protein
MSIYPPEEFQVNRFDVTPEQLERFLSLVFRRCDETEIDVFLRANPEILAFVSVFFLTGHHNAWVIPQQLIRPRIGSQIKGLKPDYLFAGENSDGITWWVLELKGANETILIEDKNGDFRFGDAANRGINQLTRYIDYCTTNQETIRGAYGITTFTEPKGVLIIGRENEFKNNEEKRRLKARHNKNNPHLQIRTYDALIRKIAEAGQISYKLPWLQKLQINLLTTKPGDDVRYHAIESEIDEENGPF